MKIHIVKDNFAILQGTNKRANEFNTNLSQQIIDKFGKKIQTLDDKKNIIGFSLNYFVDKFEQICHHETSVRFYQGILRFYENATEFVLKYNKNATIDGLPLNYIAKYRRILEFILEAGCEVKMKRTEEDEDKFNIRLEAIIDDLLFLGNRILTYANLYSEMSMIEDNLDIFINEDNECIIRRNHHYEMIFKVIINESGNAYEKYVKDNTEYEGLEDLIVALQNCFGIRYETVENIIESVYRLSELNNGALVALKPELLSSYLSHLNSISTTVAKQFLAGLMLDKSTKMNLFDLARKPYSINRYSYKPILIWNIDGEDAAIITWNSLPLAFTLYVSNAIPWGKVPKEWMQNKKFKNYVHRKEDSHDKWLDDYVEKILIKNKIEFDRNVKKLQSSKNKFISINGKGLGEIDFIILSPKTNTIFIVDCKNLASKYDVTSQRNDYDKFVNNKKAYDKTMEKKLKWFETNRDIIENHFKLKYKNTSNIGAYDIEGIFIINTPTLYMYNSKYRIYTVNKIEEVLLGNYQDMIYIIENENRDYHIIQYPFFQIPKKFDFSKS